MHAMDTIRTFLDTSRLASYFQDVPDENKINCAMAAATIGTGYLLYKNYIKIQEIKERRRSLFQRPTRSQIVKPKANRRNESRNIFQKIYHLGGLFDSLEDLDRILEFLWVPSIERGLNFRFGKTLIKPSFDLQFTEISRSTYQDRNQLGEAKSVMSADIPDNIVFLDRLSRVFGNWTLEDILRLNEDVEYMHLSSKMVLFTTNETDDNFYIVLSGCVQLNFKDETTDEPQLIRRLYAGDQVMSLMSFINFVMGKKEAYQTVEADAVSDSVVMKVPMISIVNRLLVDSHTLKLSIQRVLRRSFEVMFIACHHILGLTKELIKEKPRKKPLKNLDDIPALKKPSAEIVSEAGKKLSRFLHVDDPDLLKESNVMVAPAGFVLWELGQSETRHVVFVVEGELEVAIRSPSIDDDEDSPDDQVFYVNEGELFGALAFLTNDPREFSLRTSTKSILVIIAVSTIRKLVEKYPQTLSYLVDSIFDRLSCFARQMDFGFEWTYFESGQAVFQAGDHPKATYLVLSGRVRSLLPTDDQGAELGHVVTEYGKYDFIGLVEMWTKKRRTKTALAVRDTEVTKISQDFLRYICRRHAKVTFRILQYLTRRVVSTYKTKKTDLNSLYNLSAINLKFDPFAEDGSRSTYALFPTSPQVPVHYIAKEFEQQYEAYGPIMIIDSDFVKRRLGEHALEPRNYPELTAWLSYVETKFAKIFYVADPTPTQWSMKCFRQADVIFIAVNNDGNKDISDVESMIMEGTSLAKKELLICHKFLEGMPQRRPRYTRLWLEKRRWINFHHHLMISSKFYGLNGEKLGAMSSEVFGDHPDIARVVRLLTGNALGLALGGGGAKGAAHIGFLREFLKTRQPIDMICGVSIGSFIGALFAVHQDIDKAEYIARKWCFEVGHVRKYVMDMTLPYVSLFKGDAINGSLVEIFGDIQIEDLQIPFFTCTTDLSNNSIREHRTGSLWRFVRASMTLINYFPPICDPKDGHYLIDGGYTNLVPADMMRSMGIKYILALDISSKAIHFRDTNYGDSLSGLNILSHLTPVLAPVKVPTIMEVQSRLNWAQSVVYLNLIKKLEMLESADNSPSVLYIRLPVDFYATSGFNRFDNIRDLGSSFGKNILENIVPGDSLDEIWYWLKINRESYSFGVKKFSRLQDTEHGDVVGFL